MPNPINSARGRSASTAFKFGIDCGDYGRKPGRHERWYRIELADGREAVILASNVTVEAGALIASTKHPAREATEGLEAREAHEENTIILAPGTWLSAYMCEAIMASDPWSILALAAPVKD